MSFKKTEKQIEATALMAGDARHVMLFGGSRSGKTAIIVRNIIVRACKQRSRHISLRDTFNSIKTSIWMDTIPKVLSLAFPQLKVHYNKSDFVIIFPNGSEYWIAGLDTAQRLEKILGKEFSTLHFNECSSITYDAVNIALSRLAEKNSLAKKVYYDMNPPKKSHWTYWQFIKKLNPRDNEPLKKPDDFVSIKMNPEDNLANIDEEYLDLLKSMPELERSRFLSGEFQDVSDGQVYYAFNRERHVSVIKPRQGVTTYICMDFNVDPMTALVIQFYDNTFFVLDEIFLRNSDTIRMTVELKRRGYNGCPIIPDSTGQNRKTSGASDFQILRDAGFRIMDTFNPFVTDRVNNVNRIIGMDRIIVSPNAPKLINDLEKVVWKDNKLDQRSDKLLTHISDCLGYGLHRLDPMIKMKRNPVTATRMM